MKTHSKGAGYNQVNPKYIGTRSNLKVSSKLMYFIYIVLKKNNHLKQILLQTNHVQEALLTRRPKLHVDISCIRSQR